jgi:hypothetical protein
MNEAWIFLAIGDAGGCRGPVGGDHLVAMADSINHRLPTDEELADAIKSLVRAGLAVVAGSDYALTEWGCEVYAAASQSTQGHIARFRGAATQRIQRNQAADDAVSELVFLASGVDGRVS